MTTPIYFPVLPGLGYSVIKRPKFFNAVATAASGREVRVAYAQYPLWEWDLTYDYLPDQTTASSATASDYRDLLGFYLAMGGSLAGFLFLDPDDCSVTAQFTATGDGTTSAFTLIRTLGFNGFLEPVGYVATSGFVAYIDGVATACGLNSTIPNNQQVEFSTPPGGGSVITVDMTYYFYVRFKDDTVEFEKFMDKLWSQRLLTLMSVRSGPNYSGGCG